MHLVYLRECSTLSRNVLLFLVEYQPFHNVWSMLFYKEHDQLNYTRSNKWIFVAIRLPQSRFSPTIRPGYCTMFVMSKRKQQNSKP
jgi:hypothetical protein